MVRTSASQAEGPGFDLRVAQLLSWIRSDHYPTVPLHPGVRLGSPYKSEMVTALDVKTTGENDVSHPAEHDYPNPNRERSLYRRSRKRKFVCQLQERVILHGFTQLILPMPLALEKGLISPSRLSLIHI